MENLNLLLKRLLEHKIDFVLVGGYAAVVHGSSQVTHDLDICAVVTGGELARLKTALRDLEPRHRMNPNFQPSLEEFPSQEDKVENLYLKTSAGVLDIIGRVEPIGDLAALKKNAVTVSIFGQDCLVISLDDLIAVKRSMPRAKDKEVLKELLAVRSKLKS